MNDEPPSPGFGPPTSSARSETGSKRSETGDSEIPSGKPGLLQRIVRFFDLRGKFRARLRADLQDELSREGEDDVGFSREERILIGNILRLRELHIDDIMVPRADIEAVEQSVTLNELMSIFRKSGHSRMPVYRKTLDDPRGIVHIKDLVPFFHQFAENAPNGRPPAPKTQNGIHADGADEAEQAVNHGSPPEGVGRPAPGTLDLNASLESIDILRPLLFVPPSMPARELMAKMQTSRVQMALVIDEYGGTDGLVSLEDLVETVVGDIEDEHDGAEDAMISPTGENAWMADARVSIEDAGAALGVNLEVDDAVEDVDTLGGLVFTFLGRVPARGEMITSEQMPGFEFEILDADPRRIKRLRIFRKQGRARPHGRPGAGPGPETAAEAVQTRPTRTAPASRSTLH